MPSQLPITNYQLPVFSQLSKGNPLMADISAVFGILLSLGIVFPGLLTAWRLLFPATVARASGLGTTTRLPRMLTSASAVSVPNWTATMPLAW